jgi:hypothetical protein
LWLSPFPAIGENFLARRTFGKGAQQMNTTPNPEPKNRRTEKPVDPRNPPLRYPERHEEHPDYRGRRPAPLPDWRQEDDELED